MAKARQLSKALRALIEKSEPAIAQGFKDSVQDIKDQVVMSALVDALARKNIDEAIDILNIEEVAFAPFRSAMRNVFETSGVITSAHFTKMVRRNG